ncbi:MAG: DUF1566 domain-containing protein [Calditrichia bacterium]
MTQDIRTQIIAIFAQQFSLQNRRRTIVNNTFAGFPKMLQQIELEGAADEFSSRLYDLLVNFGTLPDSRMALVALLEEIKSKLGVDKQEKIDRVIKLLTDKGDPKSSPIDGNKVDHVTKMFFRPEDFEQAASCYVKPDCQDIDPAFGENQTERKRLFQEMDHWLQNAASSNKHILLLGDSGMGKSAFLLNYYWRSVQNTAASDHKFILIPLLISNDERFNLEAIVEGIENKDETILLLDALDEDRAAWERNIKIENQSKDPVTVKKDPQHRKRVYQLCKWADAFRAFVITCRTQFFPREEEVPDETGRLRFGPVGGIDGTKIYRFRRSYLSLFDEGQISEYLHKRFPDDVSLAEKAKLLIEKIPDLTCRPLILSYLQDLVEEEKEYRYSFQLFEVIVKAWLNREIFDSNELYSFSKCLAIELFHNEDKSDGGKSIGFLFAEIDEIAKKYDINLDTWQLTGRSLLNRDALDRFKFAHRSIVEYLYVVRWLEMTPRERPGVGWTDQMRRFLKDILRQRFSEFVEVESCLLNHGISAEVLSAEEVRKKNLRYIQIGPPSSDVELDNNSFEAVFYFESNNEDGVILDIWSGLMWQQVGSDKTLTYSDAERYVAELNSNRFGGYADWRLPDTEELLSLQEPVSLPLYIHPIFNDLQWWTWTADCTSAETVWLVDFNLGFCANPIIEHDSSIYVRAVRSGP